MTGTGFKGILGSDLTSRLEAEPTSKPASRLRAASRGSRCVWSGIFTAGYIGNLCRVTRSLHGYGLATVSGERAWFCPRFAPLPEWLLPPPARGHPVSSRGRIERHGAYEIYRGSWAQQGTAPGASTRRGVPIWDASISFGAVALTAWLGDRQCQRQWRWRFSGLDQGAIGQSG